MFKAHLLIAEDKDNLKLLYLNQLLMDPPERLLDFSVICRAGVRHVIHHEHRSRAPRCAEAELYAIVAASAGTLAL